LAVQAAGGAAHVIVADLDWPALDDDDRHHLTAVLRLRPGEPVTVTDGRGGWRRCRFSGDSGSEGELEVDGEVERVPPPAPAITVAMALVKGERPEWAVQKLVELGVDRVLLFHAERSVVRWSGDRAVRHLGRLRSVARQAVMQSRQVWLPEVAGVEEFGALVGVGGDGGGAGGGVALAEPGGSPPSLAYPTVLVGPEGGWSLAERERGLPTVSLGLAALRSETAAVAAGVLLAALRAGLVGSP
jgi:16S rRNA (uracil1498-N3)-methyltransferase